jgi:hypothetical protein
MFRQLKEKNKNLLRLKLKSALKIEQISVVSIEQVWTQKSAVQKASVDVNISYY